MLIFRFFKHTLCLHSEAAGTFKMGFVKQIKISSKHVSNYFRFLNIYVPTMSCGACPRLFCSSLFSVTRSFTPQHHQLCPWKWWQHATCTMHHLSGTIRALTLQPSKNAMLSCFRSVRRGASLPSASSRTCAGCLFYMGRGFTDFKYELPNFKVLSWTVKFWTSGSTHAIPGVSRQVGQAPTMSGSSLPSSLESLPSAWSSEAYCTWLRSKQLLVTSRGACWHCHMEWCRPPLRATATSPLTSSSDCWHWPPHWQSYFGWRTKFCSCL